MPWQCSNCGNIDRFKGYQEYTEYGTEGIIVNGNDEIIDYFDRESSNSDAGDMHIEKCVKCDSTEIQYLEEEEFEKWHDSHFDENGNFYKESKKVVENPGNFESYSKLKLLNDNLLSDVITIEEYRRGVEKIQQEMEEEK